MDKVIIKGGRVLDPETGRDEVTDVLVENGKVVKIGAVEAEGEVFDAAGKLVMPGAVDLHVHLRDMDQSHKETVSSGTAAAKQGGVTTLFAMPNTEPRLDGDEAIAKYKELCKNAAVNVELIGAITKGCEGKELTDILHYIDLGIRHISDDGWDVNDENLMREAFKLIAGVGMRMIVHPEVDSIGVGGVMNEGKVSEQIGVPGQPNEKEWRAVERALRLAEETGGRVHLTHVTTKESLDLVREFKKKSDRATCDVTPHHFMLTDERILEVGSLGKVNPPLRSEADRLALIEGFKDGTVDCIATDHAPHAMEEKPNTGDMAADLKSAAFGFTGIETMLPVTFTELYKNQSMDLMKVVEFLTLAPAKIGGLPHAGRLQEGMPANIAVVDLEMGCPVSAEGLVSKGKNTPFDGMELIGWPVKTIVN